MTGTPSLDQDSFAFYNDGTEAAATLIGSVNANPTLGVGITYGARFLVQNVGTASLTNIDLEFQYNKNGAGWNNITTTSSVIQAVNSANLTNGADCTQRIGAGTFFVNNDGVTEDGISGGNNLDLPNGQETETLLAFQIVAADVVNGDTIQLQLTRDGGPGTVALWIEETDGTQTEYTYAEAEVTKVSTGVYQMKFNPTQAGMHRYWFSSVGGSPELITKERFFVVGD
jgi:hypothetical protein